MGAPREATVHLRWPVMGWDRMTHQLKVKELTAGRFYEIEKEIDAEFGEDINPLERLRHIVEKSKTLPGESFDALSIRDVKAICRALGFEDETDAADRDGGV